MNVDSLQAHVLGVRSQLAFLLEETCVDGLIPSNLVIDLSSEMLHIDFGSWLSYQCTCDPVHATFFELWG